MDIDTNWREVKSLINDSLRSSLHYAIASVNENGEPHVTPIGSLFLGKPGRGFYFERFTRNLPRNLGGNARICVLAVNSSRWFWLRSLLGGRFSHLPAIRLHGITKELRPANDHEISLWRKRVRPARFTKGYGLMWKEMGMVREVEFDRIEPVYIGKMTRDLWR